MYKTLLRYKIEIRQHEDGQWWFHADNAEAADAIQQMIEQMRGIANV